MQTITLDLKKTPEVADVLADKEPGDEVCLYGTIKSLDDQTCVVTITEIEEHDDTDDETADEGDKSEAPASPQDEAPGNAAGEGADTTRDMATDEKSAY